VSLQVRFCNRLRFWNTKFGGKWKRFFHGPSSKRIISNFLDTEIASVNGPLATISGEPFKQCPKIATFFWQNSFFTVSPLRFNLAWKVCQHFVIEMKRTVGKILTWQHQIIWICFWDNFLMFFYAVPDSTTLFRKFSTWNCKFQKPQKDVLETGDSLWWKWLKLTNTQAHNTTVLYQSFQDLKRRAPLTNNDNN